MQIPRLPIALSVLLLLAVPVIASGSATSVVDSLSSSWDEMALFATLGNCAAAPNWVELYECNPATLAYVSKGKFQASGFISATESVLNIADTLRRNEVHSDQISKLFASYNYSEFIVNSRVSYVDRHYTLGVRPVRMQGQFQIHNPNLPFASLLYRNDIVAFAGMGYSIRVGAVDISAGLVGSAVFRREILAETSLVDFASKPAKELLYDHRMRGGFADFGSKVELENIFTASVSAHDIGYYWSGVEVAHKYLFMDEDKLQRILFSAAAIPRLWVGNLQLGGEVVQFLDVGNELNHQWFATASYFVGPLRVMTGYRPQLFRSAIALRHNEFEVSVANEWVNRIETGRSAQPRITMGFTAGL